MNNAASPEHNPFEEILEEDYHKALLETGNLPCFKSGSHKWTGHDCWLAEGFVAKIHAQCCTGCHATRFHLIGIFRIESNAARKASRFVALSPKESLPTSKDTPHPVEIAREVVSICSGCIDKLGFPKLEDIISRLA